MFCKSKKLAPDISPLTVSLQDDVTNCKEQDEVVGFLSEYDVTYVCLSDLEQILC